MSIGMKQRQLLREVCAIGKPEPKTLLDGRNYHPADTHAGSQGLAQFTARLVQAGLVLRERK